MTDDTDTQAVLETLLSDHVGASNAITQAQLATATGLPESTVRSEVRRLREQRELPIANQREGYYVIADREELQDFIAHINREIDSKRRTIEATTEAFEDFDHRRADGIPEPLGADLEPNSTPDGHCDRCGEAFPGDPYYLADAEVCPSCWEQETPWTPAGGSL